MGNYCVYMHKNKMNGKVYIGITQQKPNQRWKNGSGYKTQQLFYRAIKKYKWINFEHIILFNNLIKEEAEQKEIELIAKYKSNESRYGYNVEKGGSLNKEVSQETREKLRKNMLGKKASLETREKMRKNNARYWLGKHISKENAQKLLEANLGKKHTEERNKKTSKPVICIETGTVYYGISKAYQETGISNRHICECCKGKLKTAGGYHWEYYIK